MPSGRCGQTCTLGGALGVAPWTSEGDTGGEGSLLPWGVACGGRVPGQQAPAPPCVRPHFLPTVEVLPVQARTDAEIQPHPYLPQRAGCFRPAGPVANTAVPGFCQPSGGWGLWSQRGTVGQGSRRMEETLSCPRASEGQGGEG